MSRLFDLTEVEPQEPETSGIHVEKFLQLHEYRVGSLKELCGRLPDKGEIFFLWTVNSFNAFTFLPFVIRETGRIDELILATYSINNRIINSLIRLIDKNLIGSIDIIISDSIRSRLPKVNDHLVELSETRPVRIRYAWTHAKITLIRAGDHNLSIEGSGNWGENAQHEQYIIVNSPKVFEFRKKEIIHGINAVTI